MDAEEGRPLFRTAEVHSHQYRAIFRRVATSQKRQSKTNFCQVCCPLFIVVLVGVLQLVFQNLQNDYYIQQPPAAYWFTQTWDTLNQPYNSRNYKNMFCGYDMRNMGAYTNAWTVAGTGVDIGTLSLEGTGSGFLSLVPQFMYETYQYFANNQTSKVDGVGYVPYFNSQTGTNEQMNSALMALFLQVMNAYANNPYISNFYSGTCNETCGEQRSFQNNVFDQWTGQLLPDAVLYFNQLDTNPATPVIDYIAQTTAFSQVNWNLSNAYPGSDNQAYGGAASLMRYISSLNSAFMRSQPGVPSDYEIRGAFRTMPSVYYDSNSYFCLSCTIGLFLFPFALSMLVPTFVYALVYDKELRLLEMMRMMGMQPHKYWLVYYIFDFALATGCWIIFVISGAIFGITFFTQTDPLVYIILFVLWSFAKTSAAFFIAGLFSKARTAIIVSYVLIIASVMTAAIVNQTVWQNIPANPAFFIWPMFAFYRGIYLILNPLMNGQAGMTMGDVVSGNEMAHVFVALLIHTFAYLLVAIYLEQVVPKDWGLRRHPCFPIIDSWRFLRRKCSDVDPYLTVDESGLVGVQMEGRPEQEIDEDDDVYEQRLRVHQMAEHGDWGSNAIVLDRMHKRFKMGVGKPDKIAVHSVSLAIPSGQCFGLLGPNGAGKTTLISMMVGMFAQSAGTAVICGYDTRKSMTEIRKLTGVCPQHEILWEDLTVKEHLLFYTRLKGIPPHEEMAHVDRHMSEVDLVPQADQRARTLSGGMKRRLSVAIALVGDPKVIFLDEPTTGLDPDSRHHLWKVVQRAALNRCIILTTHSMEEADVLCNRIGIVSKGTLQCLGTQLHLKNKFGAGLKISVISEKGRVEESNKFIERVIPNVKRLTNFNNTCTYQFPRSDVSLGALFAKVEEEKAKHGILHWSLSQTTLEEVFVKIVARDEAEDNAKNTPAAGKAGAAPR